MSLRWPGEGREGEREREGESVEERKKQNVAMQSNEQIVTG